MKTTLSWRRIATFVVAGIGTSYAALLVSMLLWNYVGNATFEDMIEADSAEEYRTAHDRHEFVMSTGSIVIVAAGQAFVLLVALWLVRRDRRRASAAGTATPATIAEPSKPEGRVPH
jgi:uncharacterized membrane protein